MNASKSTRGRVESASNEQTTDWERLGRVLLVESLQVRGDRLRTAYMEMTRKAVDGDVTQEDWARLSDELQQFTFLVEEIGKATGRVEE
jgi:hypothetical protein